METWSERVGPAHYRRIVMTYFAGIGVSLTSGSSAINNRPAECKRPQCQLFTISIALTFGSLVLPSQLEQAIGTKSASVMGRCLSSPPISLSPPSSCFRPWSTTWSPHDACQIGPGVPIFVMRVLAIQTITSRLTALTGSVVPAAGHEQGN